MTDLTVLGNKDVMTSIELAELTGKRHADVIRDIKKLAPVYNDACLAQRTISLGSYKDKNNQSRPMYNLTKSQAFFLLLGLKFEHFF